MKFLIYLSNFMIPLLLFYVLGYGLLSRRDIYRDFLEGARDGLRTVGRMTGALGLPPELLPLSVVRMFSSSAATGLLLDIFKEFGTDSALGLMAGIMLSATESGFYCMSVYFGSVKIQKTGYTLPGALLATAAGVAASVWIVHII